MRAPRLLAAAAASALALAVAFPPEARSFALFGFTLSTANRDMRVTNDWPLIENTNFAADPNFPSALTIPLALWKAGTEWASTLHAGQGTGDPTQVFPDGLGSGLANFDFVYLGEAVTAPGHNAAGAPLAENDKIAHRAAVNTLGAGVLGITINPDTNGWHIEFMPDVLWYDGPSALAFGDPRVDLQGVATHEFGHAIGIAHTAVTNATMFPATGSGPLGVNIRSIELDDRQGVQAAYGVAAATKPKIFGFQGIVAAQQPLTILGQNFAPTGNAVWFRDDGADTTPIQISGLNSTGGGTQITLVPPCTVVDGDVFVKVGAGTGGATLSNGMPIVFQSGGNGAPCLQCVGPITPSPTPVLSVVPTEVIINAPAGGTLLCLPTLPLCPSPSQYSTVTQVDVGPFVLGPGQFIVDNDNQIRFTLPPFSSLGAFNVTFTNAAGISCPATLNVTAVTTPVLVTGPPIQLAGNIFNASLAAPVGFNHILVFSASNAPSVLPGIVSLGLGNAFSDVNFLPVPIPNAAGLGQLSFQIPPVPGGGTIFFQLAAVPASNPFAVLPIPVSNVTAVTVL